MKFIPWTEIEGFHHIRKYLRIDPAGWWASIAAATNNEVVYRGKVKLHGTNAAVQCLEDGNVHAQSRSNMVTPQNDNAGFARWVESVDNYWTKAHGHIVYGEWIGPGIQKGVAANQIPKKCFAVFAARPLDDSDTLIVEPEQLEELVSGIPDVYVLPWYSGAPYHGTDSRVTNIVVDWSKSDEDLTKSLETVNYWVDQVETNDPWVEENFNVKGTGEGLVFYPISHPGYAQFQSLCFKAKGEKHKNIATAAPAQVNPEAAASISGFVDLVLTQARLEQGMGVMGGADMKLTGKFVTWCLADVEKECQDELEASSLTWKEVQRPLTDKARTWYLAEAKK